MEIAAYILIGAGGATVYAICLWGALEYLKRRDLEKSARAREAA